MIRSETPTQRDLAEAFAAVSRRLLIAMEAGDANLACRLAEERGEILGRLRGDLDVVSAALVADGQRTGERALALAGAESRQVRDQLDGLGKGRQGINAYAPPGTNSAACDISR